MRVPRKFQQYNFLLIELSPKEGKKKVGWNYEKGLWNFRTILGRFPNQPQINRFLNNMQT